MIGIMVVRCPYCTQKYRLSSVHLGRKARCRCGQRFTIVDDHNSDESTVLGWVVEEADPSSRSVLGGTCIIDSPLPQIDRMPRDATAAAIDAIQAGIRLDHISQQGARFEFPDSEVAKLGVRTAFPPRCAHCGKSQDLNVHLLVWQGPGATDPDSCEPHQRIGRFRDVIQSNGLDWLAHIASHKNLPPPFDLPMPFFMCEPCAGQPAVIGWIVEVRKTRYAQLLIANLQIAAQFLRNATGIESAAYHRLIQAAQARAFH